MTVGSVSTNTDNAVINGAPAEPPVVSGASEFSEVLRTRTAPVGSADLDAIFNAAGLRYNIPPELLKAVGKVESNFRPNATSRVGAMGIMQLMPGTARQLGVTDPFDPEQNIMGGAKYLRQMLDRFGGDVRLALAAYNAGPGTITRNGGKPLDSQMRGYIPKVLGYYNGGNITAGMVGYSGIGLSGSEASGSAFGSPEFTKALSQMIFMRIIEMQMSSSSDDKKNVF